MNKYVEIFWTPAFFNNKYQEKPSFQLITQEPELLLKIIAQERQGSMYLNCPAFIDKLKNMYAIRSPFDFNIEVDTTNGIARTDRFGQDFFTDHIAARVTKPSETTPILLTLPPAYIFYSKESVIMEVGDLPIITSNSSKNTKLIIGEYDIGKWIRPIDWSIELTEGTVVNMKRNDPLFAVRFRTQNNLPTKLVRVELDRELMSVVYGCAKTKQCIKGLKFPALYELAKQYISLYLNRKKHK